MMMKKTNPLYTNRKYIKYKNHKTIVDNITFDSKKEASRYIKLKEMQQKGLITDLYRQVPFELIPTQREPSTITKKGKVKQGKVKELAIKYIADFMYKDAKDGKIIVEDTKGRKTKEYIIKRKLMLYIYGIDILES